MALYEAAAACFYCTTSILVSIEPRRREHHSVYIERRDCAERASYGGLYVDIARMTTHPLGSSVCDQLIMLYDTIRDIILTCARKPT